MTPLEASKIIGCNERHVRVLIDQGKLKARKIPYDGACGHQWNISTKEVERFSLQPLPTRGWCRGKPRNHKPQKERT